MVPTPTSPWVMNTPGKGKAQLCAGQALPGGQVRPPPVPHCPQIKGRCSHDQAEHLCYCVNGQTGEVGGARGQLCQFAHLGSSFIKTKFACHKIHLSAVAI